MTINDEALAALTGSQRAFVRHYISNKMRNATAAYRHAYPASRSWSKESVGQNAHKMLVHAKILPILEIARAEAGKAVSTAIRNYAVSKDRVIERMAYMAFSDIRDIVSWDKDGKLTFVPSDKLTDAVAAGIVSVEMRATGVIIKMGDKQTALMNLARLSDMLKVEMIVKGDKDDPIVIEHRISARKQLIDALEKMAIPEPLTIDHDQG